jgi:hypothetical protein
VGSNRLPPTFLQMGNRRINGHVPHLYSPARGLYPGHLYPGHLYPGRLCHGPDRLVLARLFAQLLVAAHVSAGHAAHVVQALLVASARVVQVLAAVSARGKALFAEARLALVPTSAPFRHRAAVTAGAAGPVLPDAEASAGFPAAGFSPAAFPPCHAANLFYQSGSSADALPCHEVHSGNSGYAATFAARPWGTCRLSTGAGRPEAVRDSERSCAATGPNRRGVVPRNGPSAGPSAAEHPSASR